VVADALEVVHQMRGEHYRYVTADGHIGERGEELPPGEGIERGQRLVQQQDARPLGQRKAERDLGLLPARQRLHRTVERHPQPREPLLRSASIPPAVEMGADPEVLGGRQLPVQVDVLSQKADAREEVRIILRGRPSEHTGRPRRRAA